MKDPSRAAGTEEQQLTVYRSVRDAIRTRLEEWLPTVEPVFRRPAR